jgi:non-ribosomal peptide synthetase component F
MHHIITDAASQAILKNEFNRLYSCKAQDLPPLRLQYKDYARWQNNEVQQALIKEQETYWLKMFAHEVPVLNLPTDYPRPVIQSFEGCAVEFLLSSQENQTLKALAKETGSTLYMSILSVFTILLSKLSGQEDIVIGTPVAARRHADLENIIGMFVNTLALRTKPPGEKEFKEFLKELKDRTLEAYENQEYQFEELVDKISLRRDTGRNPIFDVMFNLLNQQEYTDDMPGYEKKEARQYDHRKSTSKFDLTLTAVDLGERLLFTIEYCSKLFEPQTINRFISYFKRILTLLWEDSQQKLSRISIITAAEKHRILYEFNDTKADYRQDITIHKLFVEQVEKTPDQIALVGKDEGWKARRVEGKKENISITYKQLNQRSDQLAYILREKGVKSDTIVGMMMDRSLEMIMGILAILKAGGAYLPIEPKYPEERKRYILADSNAKILASKKSEVNGWNGSVIPLLRGVPEGRGVSELATRSPQPAASTFNLAYVIYTSGSTGRPKGVMVEHKSIINILSLLHHEYPLMDADTYLLKTSYVFDVSVTELFGWFLGGGRLAILEKGGENDPKKIMDTIEILRITHINFVPSMFNVFLEGLNRQNIGQLSGLKYIFLAGEALLSGPVNKFRQFNTKIALENLYGPTEGTIYSRVLPGDCICRVQVWPGGI